MVRGFLVFTILVLFGNLTTAQPYAFQRADTTTFVDENSRYGFIEIRAQAGRFVDPGTLGMKEVARRPVYGFDLRYGRYGYGRKLWQQLHRFPTFGIGMGTYVLGSSRSMLGTPWSSYIFYTEPFFQRRRHTVTYDLSLGASFGWKPYDTLKNPDQRALGSSVNVLAALSLRYQFEVSHRVAITLGPTITHFSNGRTRSPNRGLNLYGAQISARYSINVPYKRDGRYQLSFINVRRPLPAFRPHWEVYTVGGLGFVSDSDFVVDRHYITTAISADLARHYAFTGKYGAGIDWFYDGGLQHESGSTAGFARSQWWGIHVSHEYMIHRWTFVTQPGLYFGAQADKGRWFGRVAVRYDLTQHLFIRGGVRIYKTFRSDSIEGSLGWSF